MLCCALMQEPEPYKLPGRTARLEERMKTVQAEYKPTLPASPKTTPSAMRGWRNVLRPCCLPSSAWSPLPSQP